MKTIIQKFGGTSLTDKDRRIKSIHHIKNAKKLGYNVVVVVSAMGRKGDPYATDTLIALLEEGSKSLPEREMDLLLSTGELISAAVLAAELWQEGYSNTILTGGQAGIITNETFSNALITSLQPKRILDAFKEGSIVIVPGFQGQTLTGEITTLGRGGSDTTAAALGVALQADVIDIFTDVEGIMTADPRIVEDAKPLEMVTYTEICHLAHLGAKVIHPRAVEIAMQKNIPIRVRSTFNDDPGTLVTNYNEVNSFSNGFKQRIITGVTQTANITQIKVLAERGEYDLQLQVFNKMAEYGISIDFINVNPTGVVYTVQERMADTAEKLLREMGYNPQLTPHCAKVSVVGAGIAGTPGIMAKIVEALVKNDITILQSADSHTTIWVLIYEKDMAKAVRAIHQKFELHRHNLD